MDEGVIEFLNVIVFGELLNFPRSFLGGGVSDKSHCFFRVGFKKQLFLLVEAITTSQSCVLLEVTRDTLFLFVIFFAIYRHK